MFYKILGIADDVGGSPINIGDDRKIFKSIKEAISYAEKEDGFFEALEVYAVEVDHFGKRLLDFNKPGYYKPAISIK